jgi:hypothetical protein
VTWIFVLDNALRLRDVDVEKSKIVELLELRKLRYPCFEDLVPGEPQGSQLRQSAQRLHAAIGYLGVLEIQDLHLFQPGQLRQAGIVARRAA